MKLQPANLEELRAALADANQRREVITGVDLRAFNRVLAYQPEDMTVTVQTGLGWQALQTELAGQGQWLPLDPPEAGRMTIGDVLNANASGPRRFGYGTIREHLLGLKVVLADGRLIQSGGKVVKNVAGYDVQKLLVGSQGTLGVMVEATFKVRPLPEKEICVCMVCPTLAEAARLIEAILNSPLAPVVLDLHNISMNRSHPNPNPNPNPNLNPNLNPTPLHTASPDSAAAQIVLAFAGTGEDVEWQMNKVRELGATEPATLDYETEFRANTVTGLIQQCSVLPSRLMEIMGSLGCQQFVARAGNGALYYRGGNPPPKPALPMGLNQRVKEIFDPNHVFPALNL